LPAALSGVVLVNGSLVSDLQLAGQDVFGDEEGLQVRLDLCLIDG
jgi:hypothetical protein